MMKKMTGVLAAALLSAALLSGCAETFTCGLCGKTVTERPNKAEFMGQKITICGNCDEGLDQLNEGIDGLSDLLG